MTGTAGRALTPLQAGMLFHSQLAPRSGVYVQQLVLEIPESNDAKALRQACERVAARQEPLHRAIDRSTQRGYRSMVNRPSPSRVYVWMFQLQSSAVNTSPRALNV